MARLKTQTLVGRIAERLFKKYGKPDYLDPERMRGIIAACGPVNERLPELPPRFGRRFEITDLAGVPAYRLAGGRHTVLYLHGGSFIKHPNYFHWAFAWRLHKKAGCTLLLPIYPKAPRHTYAEANAAVLSAYCALLAQADAQNIIVMGDSAGGTLAMALALMLKDKGLPQPLRYVLFSPAVDLTFRPELKEYAELDPLLALPGVREVILAWIGGESSGVDVADPLVSPYYGDLSGLPPTFTFAGTHDMMLLDSARLHKKLLESGVESTLYEGERLNHVYPIYPIPEGLAAARVVVGLVKEAFGQGPAGGR